MSWDKAKEATQRLMRMTALDPANDGLYVIMAALDKGEAAERALERHIISLVQKSQCPLVGKEPRDFNLCDDGDTEEKCVACWRSWLEKEGK